MSGIYVPLVRQSYDYSCGAASLASCLYYWGVWSGREPELYPLLGTTCDGTKGESIIQVAQSFGLRVEYESHLNVGDLRMYLQAGWTAILNIQAWGNYGPITNFGEVWEDGHYVVLVNVINSDVILMDPSIPGQYGRLSIEQLNARWHDWSDDGNEKEYHTAILIKGEIPALLEEPLRMQEEEDNSLQFERNSFNEARESKTFPSLILLEKEE
jgi:ABC-type bacteriocin/lantibiotic exporter with double-glycine peptidase domain